jgi:hydroxymethylglutaryl-CoA lyase
MMRRMVKWFSFEIYKEKHSVSEDTMFYQLHPAAVSGQISYIFAWDQQPGIRAGDISAEISAFSTTRFRKMINFINYFMGNGQVILEEQGLRDGLQTLPVNIPTIKKLQYITQLTDAGIKRIQVASFVHPKLVPQMADAEAVIKGLPANDTVVFSALALNGRGVQRAIDCGIRHLAISISASDTHSRKNAGKSLAEAKDEFTEMVALALQHGITVRGGIQCAFGCRYEGNISEAVVYELVQHQLASGIQELALADSTGMAHPAQIKSMTAKVMALCGTVPLALHLHNTENKGYANLVAALETGVRQFDTAFGGLGGCPFIKGATGNIATEDTVHLLQQMGYETGIDNQKVARISRDMEKVLSAPLPGLLYHLLDREDIKMN